MLKSHFSANAKGHLVIGNIDTMELVKKFDTPLYVVDERRVRENYRRFYQAFASRWKQTTVCYAYKANSNLAICKILQSEGAGADVSSVNELKSALRLHVLHDKIVLNGNNKSAGELKLAIANEVLINVDSLDELLFVDGIAAKVKKPARIGARVNPDIKAPTHPYIATGLKESKFGLDIVSGEALEVYAKAMKLKNVRVLGIHCHIGSQILDPAPFREEAEKVMSFVTKLKKELGLELEIVDLGGGLGIPYKFEELPMAPDMLASNVVPIIKRVVEENNLKPPTLMFEPGRYIVADAGVLLLGVGCFKERKGMPSWVAGDAGINALIRPALYGAYHHIDLANKVNAEHDTLVNVAGPLCESSDVLGRERKLPRPKRGDVLAVFDVGAYGLAMSSQHTAQARPAMVLVNGKKASIIRQRESYEDLTRLDKIPRWMN